MSSRYRVSSYRFFEYSSEINPYAVAPEPRVANAPPTAYTARNILGRQIIPGHELRWGGYYFLNLRGKEDSQQETILILGNSGTGKTLLARILIEIMWFNGFTPIFTISKKEPFIKLDTPNLRDFYWLSELFKDWVQLYTRMPYEDWEKLGYEERKSRKDMGKSLKEKVFRERFEEHGFKVITYYPPYAKQEPHFKLNPRFLDPWSLADAYGLNIESRYMRIFDKIFTDIWSSHNPPKTTEEFIEELKTRAEHIQNSIARVNLLSIATYLESDIDLFQDKLENPLYKAYMDKTIVNLSFFQVPQSLFEPMIITNFIRQVIDAMQKISSSALIFDDVGYFMKNKSIQRVLDELVNIEGRVGHAGIKKILISQSLNHFPRILRDLRIYNKIFYSKPRNGWFRRLGYQFQCELIDNDTGENALIWLRPPITGGE